MLQLLSTSLAEHCVSQEVMEGKKKSLLWGREPWQPEAPSVQPQQSDMDVCNVRLKHLQSPNK